jgi:hypothetical protein
MPRYFFALVVDSEGQELADDDAARRQAALVAEKLTKNRSAKNVGKIVVTNERGEVVHTAVSAADGVVIRLATVNKLSAQMPGVTKRPQSVSGPPLFLRVESLALLRSSRCSPGQRVSAVSNDAGTFSLSVTELTD